MSDPLDSTLDFDEAFEVFNQQTVDLPEDVRNMIRGVFMSGGFAAIGVLSNRLSKLPGTTDPGDMVKALINTIQVASAELEQKANEHMENKTFGTG